MMASLWRRLFCSLALIGVSACGARHEPPGAPQHSGAMPERLDVTYAATADPLTDVGQAIRAQDLRLLLIFGLTPEIPGYEAYPELVVELESKWGTRSVFGTSDFPTENVDAHEDAVLYAEIYNMMLLRHL